MESYKTVLDYLKAYNEDELFYKEYYEIQNDPQAVRHFIQRIGVDTIRARNLLLPETILSNLHFLSSQALSAPKHDITEHDVFIHEKNERDVFLVKHNRFSPVFLHRHHYFEMFYVMEGQCRQQISDTCMSLKTGDLCFVAPQTPHTLEVFDDSIVINILIRSSTFDDIFFNVLRDKNILSLFFISHLYGTHQLDYMIFHTADDTEICHSILSMFLEQFADDVYTNHIVSNLLSIFFIKLIRKYGDMAALPAEHPQTNPILRDILSYIYDHYQTVTLHGLAEQFHFTTVYCSRLIKNYTGKSFKDLLKDIRLKKAENMLITTNMKISAVSEHLGYENKESFIRLFKQVYGMSPGTYRNLHTTL